MRGSDRTRRSGIMAILAIVATASLAAASPSTSLQLGDEASEAAVGLVARSAPVAADPAVAVGESVRLLTPANENERASIAFDVKLDPNAHNYLTLRLWGSDTTWTPVTLRADADSIELSNLWSHATREPPAPGRFLYRTFPIPIEVTRGKTSLRLRIETAPAPQTIGAFRDADQPPPKMTYRSSFAIYGLHTHVDPWFEPDASERQGLPLAWGPPATKPAGYPETVEAEEPLVLDGPAGAETLTRRQAYADFFHEAFEWRRQDRRSFTNQTIYVARTLYRLQAALRALGDDRALTPAQALRYVHEAFGLSPLRSREFGIDSADAGYPYYLLTRAGPPHRAIDGNGKTDWRVSAPPPEPMARGNWLEIELNRPVAVGHVEVHWLGDAPYEYKVHKKPRDDFRKLVREGRSAGGGDSLEKDELARRHRDDPSASSSRPRRTRTCRASTRSASGARRSPASYPQMADRFAPVETARRVLYIDFEHLPWGTRFNPKLPYADGGAALRLMPRTEAFDGGHVDFTIAATPMTTNWITLKLWESHDGPMTKPDAAGVRRAVDGVAPQRDQRPGLGVDLAGSRPQRAASTDRARPFG